MEDRFKKNAAEVAEVDSQIAKLNAKLEKALRSFDVHEARNIAYELERATDRRDRLTGKR